MFSGCRFLKHIKQSEIWRTAEMLKLSTTVASESNDTCQRAMEVECAAVTKPNAGCEASASKKPRLAESVTNKEDVNAERKKKVAMLLVYSGKGYLGMQRNPGFKTIESDLLDALVKAETVRPDHIEQPGVKMGFQRAARTDKGVSAAGQVVSLKMLINDEEVVKKLNCHLPPQIRVLGLKRVTKGYDSKNSCDSRTYCYITPTFAFAPSEESPTESYRVTENILPRVQEILQNFKGTHNFHNFTSGKKPNDPSAKRYIMDFTVGSPFVRGDIEYVAITVRGQSFMLHQIRKMIGITIAIMRGMTGTDTIQRSWDVHKVDIPKAPGLGLILDRLHYDAYNRKYGSDGMHEKIDWDQYKSEIDSFKENYIYPTIFETEKNDKSMLNWLATLPLHHYTPAEGPMYTKTPSTPVESLVKEENNVLPEKIQTDSSTGIDNAPATNKEETLESETR